MQDAAAKQQTPDGQPLDSDDMVSTLKTAESRLVQPDPTIFQRYAWLEAMINHVPDYIYAKDLSGRFLFANKAIVETHGLQTVDQMVGLTDFDLHASEAADGIDVIERRVMETGLPDLGFEERRLIGDGWLMMSRVPLRDETGKVIGVVGASRDISARKYGESLMKAQTQLLQAVARGVSLPQFLQDTTELVNSLLRGASARVHLDRDQEPTAAPAVLACGEVISQSSPDRVTFPIPSGGGGRHGEIVLEGAATPDASVQEFLTTTAQTVGIAIDRHQDAERIRFLAEHDALTGLPNRALLDRLLDDMLKDARATSSKIAVVFLDLDNFKLVNDSLGHAAGDDLLRIVANRISKTIGRDGMVSRIGGDEFILALKQTEQDFAERLEHVRCAIARPLTLAGVTLQLTCSMGVSCFDRHGDTAEKLFAHADMAMYRVKEAGRNGIQVFDPAMADQAHLKLHRSEELRDAVERDEFVLHFQPQQDLTSGAVIGVEALLRWKHPRNGLISPADFIPLAEETGLILPIGEAVLRKACRQAKTWQDQGLAPFVMAVNMSPRQFQEPGMTKQVAAALADSGLEAKWLEIEVTESLLMRDIKGAVVTMHELTKLGVALAVDDFGTGHSSLSALKSFPLSRLKIDRSFIADIPTDPDDMAITSAIISLAHTLQLDVIAEGVETVAQAEFLKQAGCPAIQGYLFSKPLPAEAITELMLGKAKR